MFLSLTCGAHDLHCAGPNKSDPASPDFDSRFFDPRPSILDRRFSILDQFSAYYYGFTILSHPFWLRMDSPSNDKKTTTDFPHRLCQVESRGCSGDRPPAVNGMCGTRCGRTVAGICFPGFLSEVMRLEEQQTHFQPFTIPSLLCFMLPSSTILSTRMNHYERHPFKPVLTITVSSKCLSHLALCQVSSRAQAAKLTTDAGLCPLELP